ncbi:hypothetical protein [Nocardia sp. NPDC003979]
MPPTPVQLDVSVSGTAEPGPAYRGGSDVLGEQSQNQLVTVDGSTATTRPWTLYALSARASHCSSVSASPWSWSCAAELDPARIPSRAPTVPVGGP